MLIINMMITGKVRFRGTGFRGQIPPKKNGRNQLKDLKTELEHGLRLGMTIF